MQLNHQETQTIYIVRLVFGSISLLGSASIITIFLLYKHLRSFLMRLVIYLIVSDGLRSISLLLPVENKVACFIQAILLEYTVVSAIFWSLIISIALYLGTVLRKKNVEKFEVVFLIAGYVLPGVLTGIQFIIGAKVESAGWCWIKIRRSHNIDIAVRFICFYAPILLSITICSVLYCHIIVFIRRNFQGFPDESADKRKITRRLLMYPFVIIMCIFPVFIMRAELFSEEKFDDYQVSLAIVVIGGLSGLFNAIIYGLTDSVKETICKGRRKKMVHSSITEVSWLTDFI